MKDQSVTLYVVLFCMTLILGWMFLIFSPLRTETQDAENMVNRRLNRIQTRATLPDPPKVTPEKLEKQLTALTVKQPQMQERVAKREAHFVSLETVDELRQLRLGIAKLAKASGLNVKRFGAMAKDGEVTDSAAALKSQIRASIGRPVLVFEASGNFIEISNFISHLDQMSWSVAVLNLSIIAPSFKDMVSKSSAARLLQVKMELAL